MALIKLKKTMAWHLYTIVNFSYSKLVESAKYQLNSLFCIVHVKLYTSNRMMPQRWNRQSDNAIVSSHLQRTQLVSTQDVLTSRVLTSGRQQSADYSPVRQHSAARQYIDYCNGMNNHQPVTTAVSRDRSLRGRGHIVGQPISTVPAAGDEIRLDEVLSVTTGANVVSLQNNAVSVHHANDPAASLDEYRVIEAVQAASLHPRPPVAALQQSRSPSRLHQYQAQHSRDLRCPRLVNRNSNY